MSKFAIDPGHGDVDGSLGGDGGAVGYLNEQICVLDIANRLISKLQAMGHEAWNVRPVRALSVVDSLQKRCDAADRADYMVSIHLNSGGGRGSEVFAMSEEGYNLASRVLKELVSIGFTNRGVKDGSHLYVIRHSRPAAILVECCFVDTQEDANKYNSEKIANAILMGLISDGLTSTKPVAVTPKTPLQKSIEALQYDFNKIRGTRLKVDGIVGRETIEAINGYIVKKGERNDIVKWIQEKLIGWGYNIPSGDTGYFGADTEEFVKKLQKNWNKKVDGIIGSETWDIFITN